MGLEQTTKKGEPVFRDKKILVVDDLEKWLKDTSNNLIYYGSERKNIYWAYDIKEGERVYYTEKQPIAITDINFDKNNIKDTQGLVLIPKMRGINPEGIIVAMSSLKNIEQKTLEAGADYFIQKGNQFIENFDRFVEWYKTR